MGNYHRYPLPDLKSQFYNSWIGSEDRMDQTWAWGHPRSPTISGWLLLRWAFSALAGSDDLNSQHSLSWNFHLSRNLLCKSVLKIRWLINLPQKCLKIKKSNLTSPYDHNPAIIIFLAISFEAFFQMHILLSQWVLLFIVHTIFIASLRFPQSVNIYMVKSSSSDGVTSVLRKLLLLQGFDKYCIRFI